MSGISYQNQGVFVPSCERGHVHKIPELELALRYTPKNLLDFWSKVLVHFQQMVFGALVVPI